ITARVTIDEIAREIEIPTDIAVRKTFLERACIKSIRIIEQNLEEIDSRLRGSIRLSVLINEHGVPTLQNAEAKWTSNKKKPTGTQFELITSGSSYEHSYGGSSTCCDGILICGD